MPYLYYGKWKTTDFFDYALTTKSMSRKKEGLRLCHCQIRIQYWCYSKLIGAKQVAEIDMSATCYQVVLDDEAQKIAKTNTS